MAGPFRGDGEAVELAREADGEIADVDHLLHLAQALLSDFSGFERDQLAERLLVGAEFLAEETHELAAARRRNAAPSAKGVGTFGDLGLDRARVVIGDAADLGTVDRRADDPVAGGCDAEVVEDVCHVRDPSFGLYFPLS
jgi:hypothetical protein